MAHGTTSCDIPFTKTPGEQVQTVGFEPHDYFALFINPYADQFIPESNLRRGSCANDWHPTDRKEMKQFLGLFFLMGIIHKPDIHMYWCKAPYSVPPFTVL